MRLPAAISLPESPRLSPPEAREVHCSSVDSQILQGLSRKMAIIRPLHSCPGIVALGIRFHAIQRQAHDFAEQLADLVFRELVFGGELKDGREGCFILCV